MRLQYFEKEKRKQPIQQFSTYRPGRCIEQVLPPIDRHPNHGAYCYQNDYY